MAADTPGEARKTCQGGRGALRADAKPAPGGGDNDRARQVNKNKPGSPDHREGRGAEVEGPADGKRRQIVPGRILPLLKHVRRRGKHEHWDDGGQRRRMHRAGYEPFLEARQRGCRARTPAVSGRGLGAGRQAEAGRRARAHCGPGGGTVWTGGPPFSYTVASSAVASRSYRITSVSSCSVAVAESSFVWRMTIFAGGPAAAPGALPAAQDRACARRAPTLPRRAARGPGPSSKLPGGRDSATAGKKKRHDVTGRDQATNLLRSV